MLNLSPIVSSLSALSAFFGFSAPVANPYAITMTDTRYSVTTAVGRGFGRKVTTESFYTTDSPAVLAIKIAKSTPMLAERRGTVWVSDPRHNGMVNPFRFRVMMVNGEVVAKIIDPRKR